LDRDGHMKLSDFGLCKPIVPGNLPPLPHILEEAIHREISGEAAAAAAAAAAGAAAAAAQVNAAGRA